MQMDRNELAQLWTDYRSNPSNEALRNRLVEVYLPLVKDHAERVWTRFFGWGENPTMASWPTSWACRCMNCKAGNANG